MVLASGTTMRSIWPSPPRRNAHQPAPLQVHHHLQQVADCPGVEMTAAQGAGHSETGPVRAVWKMAISPSVLAATGRAGHAQGARVLQHLQQQLPFAGFAPCAVVVVQAGVAQQVGDRARAGRTLAQVRVARWKPEDLQPG